MAKAYSQDLRDRVIEAVEGEGMSRRGAAARFGISESSAIKWVQRYRLTGERGPCLLYTSPSPRDGLLSRMPSSA